LKRTPVSMLTQPLPASFAKDPYLGSPLDTSYLPSGSGPFRGEGNGQVIQIAQKRPEPRIFFDTPAGAER
jgi:hypothetical protein